MSSLDGVLVIDKPAGPSSHDVVAVVRRALRAEKVGHTGTLDPLATGVLPLVVGRATRLASLLTSGEKEYVAVVRFGAATATYDAEGAGEGEPSAAGGMPVPHDASEIERVLPSFTGTYLQQPPAFSAKKIAGVPAYKLARRQQPVDVKPVEVTVTALELERYAAGVAELRIACSTGFYVRSLAHDLGQRLGCGAHLEGLRRTRSGDFGLDAAHALTDVLQPGAPLADWVIPMGRVLPDIPAISLTDAGAGRARHGNTLRPGDWIGDLPESAEEKDRIRLLDAAGQLLGLAERRAGGLLHPTVVLV
ncbi:MAG TPA: tRNA pseudouridine(55) synthase TruB [Vicinamibacterales bacterium]|nr:tRNA pseudouridine(55) synthase TruB [Vicinamibacterales bacterium]